MFREGAGSYSEESLKAQRASPITAYSLRSWCGKRGSGFEEIIVLYCWLYILTYALYSIIFASREHYRTCLYHKYLKFAGSIASNLGQ